MRRIPDSQRNHLNLCLIIHLFISKMTQIELKSADDTNCMRIPYILRQIKVGLKD